MRAWMRDIPRDGEKCEHEGYVIPTRMVTEDGQMQGHCNMCGATVFKSQNDGSPWEDGE